MPLPENMSWEELMAERDGAPPPKANPHPFAGQLGPFDPVAEMLRSQRAKGWHVDVEGRERVFPVEARGWFRTGTHDMGTSWDRYYSLNGSRAPDAQTTNELDPNSPLARALRQRAMAAAMARIVQGQ